MSIYGQKLVSGSNINILTPDCATIVSAGTVTMPNSLNGDGTYGYDIDLPGSSAINVSKIGVVCLPSAQTFSWEAYALYFFTNTDASHYYYTPAFCLDDGGSFNYYTRSEEHTSELQSH